MLYKSPKSKPNFVTLDKESFMSTLWRREEFLRICSKEYLAAKAQDVLLYPDFFLYPDFLKKVRIHGTTSIQCLSSHDALQIVYILKFKRSIDRNEGFLEVKEAEANEQHKNIIGALRAGAPKWKFEQINFVVGNRGSVVKSDFYTKLKKLDVQEGKKATLFADHVTQVCEAHNRVIVSFLQQVQGGTRPTTEGSRENIGHNVHVWGDGERNTRSYSVKAGAVEQEWTQGGKLGITIQDPPRVQRTDTFIVFYLFVLYSVPCLKTCHFTTCFASLWRSISVSVLILHVTSSRVSLYLLIFITLPTQFIMQIQRHTHKNTFMTSTQEEWRQPGTGAWLKGAEERLLTKA